MRSGFSVFLERKVYDIVELSMESVDSIKEDIYTLLSRYFGEVTKKTFKEFYIDENLPVTLDASLRVLEDLIGRPKAIQELNAILVRYKMQEIPNE